MAEVKYEHVLSDAQRLSPAEQLRLVEQIAGLLRRTTTPGKTRSILELRGLGKEIWQGVDAQTYIDQERDAWTG